MRHSVGTFVRIYAPEEVAHEATKFLATHPEYTKLSESTAEDWIKFVKTSPDKAVSVIQGLHAAATHLEQQTERSRILADRAKQDQKWTLRIGGTVTVGIVLLIAYDLAIHKLFPINNS